MVSYRALMDRMDNDLVELHKQYLIDALGQD